MPVPIITLTVEHNPQEDKNDCHCAVEASGVSAAVLAEAFATARLALRQLVGEFDVQFGANGTFSEAASKAFFRGLRDKATESHTVIQEKRK